ncbi:hypothetical protein QEZ54_20545 [Catellatospora sp. KI3]|uniref:DUF6602 domain-containing protein n=1 Tax=Catellatospora sp. KI3 TaxID=3041620 RepID=UPI0024827E17|nr:DUF6602 domain-containing protein [Catellatospora sp. KI3]MDI1463374.1 hypothetical protein [Catellatospora sp. KI3]
MTESKRLELAFSYLRNAASDSDVKGGGNEQMIAELLRKSFRGHHIVTNTQVIDSHDMQSAEIDVAVCNAYQPFEPDPHQPLLIVEGVDAVIQVKAKLDKREIERTFKNAASVKQLRRRFVDQDTVRVDALGDAEHFVMRVPYFCFAFSSLEDRTVHDHIIEAAKDVPSELQPDAFFILDRCMFLNVRDNNTSLALRIPVSGWVHNNAGGHVIPMMFRYLYKTAPQVRRLMHPVLFYPISDEVL